MPGSFPVRAVISAASRSMMGPSLSVVQTVPSWRRKLAPALSSPPKQHEPSNNPGTNHLKPTGTSQNRRPSRSTTRSMRLLRAGGLPPAGWAGPADCHHVDDASEVLDVWQDEVVFVRARRLDGRGKRYPLDPGIALAQEQVRAPLNPSRHVGVGGAPVGRVVFEAAVLGRVVR